MKQLIAFRKQHLTLDWVILLICSIALTVASSSVARAGIGLDTTRFPKHSETSFEIAIRQKVVVSTTIPNEADFVTADAIQEEARRQEVLEKEFTEEIAERERLLEEQRIEAERQAYRDYVDSIVCDPCDIARISGLRKEDYALLTEGTWWEGYEDTLYELETEYGVNAMFAMSVSTLESYFGTSVRASSRHNYYGIELDRNWSGLYDNTIFWGGMMNRVYIEDGVVSVWNIGPIYCPPNRQWEVYMNDNMNMLYNSLITKLTNTVQ